VSRTEARIKCSIWNDRDFLALAERPRMVYLFLTTQEDLTMCGAIPYRAARWAKRLGYAVKQLSEALALLADARFLVLDAEEEEVWLRTLIKHDGLLAKPNWLPSAKRAMAQVSSPLIRSAFAAEYPQLASEWGVDPIPHGIPHGIPDGMSESEGIGDRGKGIYVTTPQTALSCTQSPALVVFQAWMEATGHPGALFDTKRQGVIGRALKHFDQQYLVETAQGWKNDAYCQGANKDGTVYDRVDLIFRDAEHIEKFHDLFLHPEKGLRRTPREQELAAKLTKTTPESLARVFKRPNFDPEPVA
jgi:hypothetical protein